MTINLKKNMVLYSALTIYLAVLIYVKLCDPNGLYASYRAMEALSGDYSYFFNSLYFIPPRPESIFDIYFVKQFLANMLLMVPFGYFTAKLISNKVLRITLIVSGCFLLEILQPLLKVGVLSGITILFEMTGAFLGVAAARFIPRILSRVISDMYFISRR